MRLRPVNNTAVGRNVVDVRRSVALGSVASVDALGMNSALSQRPFGTRLTTADHQPLLRRFLPRILKQEIERLVRPDMTRDPADRAFLLELRPHHRHRLALLPGDALDFAVD